MCAFTYVRTHASGTHLSMRKKNALSKNRSREETKTGRDPITTWLSLQRISRNIFEKYNLVKRLSRKFNNNNRLLRNCYIA